MNDQQLLDAITDALDRPDVDHMSDAEIERMLDTAPDTDFKRFAVPVVAKVQSSARMARKASAAEPRRGSAVAVCLSAVMIFASLLLLMNMPRADVREKTDRKMAATHPPRQAQEKLDAPAVEAVAVGDRIETATRERRRVTLPDGSILYVNEGTAVAVTARREVRVERGEVFVEVQPQETDGAREKFVVRTPHRDVVALGTKFAVTADPTNTDVLVTQGKVKVSGVETPLVTGQNFVDDELLAAPRASEALRWTRELMAAAESPLIPKNEHAGGALIAKDTSGDEINLTLRKQHIDVHVEDGFARTTIDQAYFNHSWGRLEGTFYFPLPADASLSRLAMYVGDTLMEGGMAERDHARNVFEEIRYTRRDPALLEWVDGSTFKMRVFPLEGRQEKRIIISYTQKLDTAYGRTHYRFPSGHSLELVRDWSAHVRVKGWHARKGVKPTWDSPSHEFTASRDGDDLILETTANQIADDRDVVVNLSDELNTKPGEESARFATTLHEGHRYFMLRYRPHLRGQLKRDRRHWVFLFESSGDRNPLLARVQVDVIKTLLDHAEHDDTFSVVTAATRTKLWRDAPAKCTAENIAAAVQALETTHLVGALDLEKALKQSTAQTAKDRETYLVHVGTALPALGESDSQTLVKLLPKDGKYVGVGVGKRWSPAFMEAAANRTGGYFTQINPDEQIGWRAFELLSIINSPRLLDLTVNDNGDKLRFHTLVDSLADGEELTAVTRLEASAKLPTSVTVRGTFGDQKFTKEIKVNAVAENAAYLPRIWAKQELTRLTDAGAEKHKAEIISLSKAMYVMSPYTSLLVLENEAMYAQYKVDRGRKDHWALYGAPKKIKVQPPEPKPAPAAVAEKPGDQDPVGDLLKTILVRVPRRTLWANNGHWSYNTSTSTAWNELRGEAYGVPIAATHYWGFTPDDDYGLLVERLKGFRGVNNKLRDDYVTDSKAYFKFVDAIDQNSSSNVLRVFERGGQFAPRWGVPQGNIWEDRRRWSERGLMSSADMTRSFYNLQLPRGGETFFEKTGVRLRRRYPVGDTVIPDFTLPLYIQQQTISNGGYSGIAFSSTTPYTVGIRQQTREFFPLFIDTGSDRLEFAGVRGEEERVRFALSDRNGRFNPGLFHAYSGRHFHLPDFYYDTRRRAGARRSNTSSFVTMPLGVSLPMLDDWPRSGTVLGLGAPGQFTTQYAWPSNANYPNGAAVNYPRAYSSFGVGLGVPMGWRNTTLEWDDGWWGDFDGDGYLPVDHGLASFNRFILQVPPGENTPLFLIDPPAYRGLIPLVLSDFDQYSNPLAHAPGFQTTAADILGVLEAELDEQPRPGEIDSAARKLLDRVRNSGWRRVTLTSRDGDTMDIVFDGRGRYVYEHEVSLGLRERVVCDGETLWHVYPELGLGTKRRMSRAHRQQFANLVPGLLLPLEDLAIGRHVRMVNDHTIALVPIENRGAGPLSRDGEDSKAESADDGDSRGTMVPPHVRLVIQNDRLAETQLVQDDKVLARVTLSANGHQEWVNEAGEKVAEHKWRLDATDAPSLSAESEELVLLPMPVRPLTHSLKDKAVTYYAGQAYDKLSKEEALVVAAHGWTHENVALLKKLFDVRCFSKNDHRLGWYTLLTACSRPGRYARELATGAVREHHKNSPMSQLLASRLHEARETRTGQEYLVPKEDGFARRLAMARNLFQRWNGKQAVANRPRTQVNIDRDRDLAFLKTLEASPLAWMLLTRMQESDDHAESQLKFVEAAKRWFDDPQLGLRARYDAAQWRALGGEKEQAQEAFTELYQAALDHGRLLPLDESIRNAYQATEAGKREWRRLLRSTFKELMSAHHRVAEAPTGQLPDAVKNVMRRLSVVTLLNFAARCRGLKDADIATTYEDALLADWSATDDAALTYRVVTHLAAAERFQKAEPLVAALLMDADHKKNEAVWRLASQVAAGNGDELLSLARMNMALQLEFDALPDVFDIQIVRQHHGELLERYASLDKRLASAEVIDDVKRIADRWRSVDPNVAPACQAAAKVLNHLGEEELAWDYLTTPVALRPNEAAPWLAMAGSLDQSGDVDLADRAYTAAFQAEATNAQILWDHAEFLKKHDRKADRKAILKSLADGEWQRRFQNLKKQARQALQSL